jgi:hypothetical protein
VKDGSGGWEHRGHEVNVDLGSWCAALREAIAAARWTRDRCRLGAKKMAAVRGRQSPATGQRIRLVRAPDSGAARAPPPREQRRCTPPGLRDGGADSQRLGAPSTLSLLLQYFSNV